MIYRATIHQSLTRPMLLAGAERAPALANWIMAAGILFGGGLHWYTIATSALLVTHRALGFDAGREVRSRTEPSLLAARAISARISTSHLGRRAASARSFICAHTSRDSSLTRSTYDVAARV